MPVIIAVVLSLLVVVVLVLGIAPARRALLARALIGWFRRVLPPISETESAAIDAGTVWWDGQLFTGRPDWSGFFATPPAALTADDEAFLSGPVEELCRRLDVWEIEHELNDLPEHVWRYLRTERFFGLLIPTEYGGRGLSPRAQSEVVMKIASRSMAAGVTVMVPNSLGPGELLLHYGTDEQKRYYLPRLASGDEIPAFALTSTWAGSDAASMVDEGIVCYGDYGGERVLGLRLSWEKRYITLGPVCTVLGLAFKTRDPEGLLGGDPDLGITCALVPTNLPGIEIGRRHDTGSAFQNGPNVGRNVFVPLERVIGGREMIGHGWRMLMDCLSVGRAISLPALGVAAAKLCSRTAGAYARIRRQFRTPIGYFEGIEEQLARIAGSCYRMDASRLVTAAALNAGEKPAIVSAILKYHNTEGMRDVVKAAMDVHGGRAVCDGPSNYLQAIYAAVPVAITVEGANILTRNLIIFGQGAIRCHPYVLAEIRAAANPDAAQGLEDFDRAFFAHVRHTMRNMLRALTMGLGAGRVPGAREHGANRRYLRRLTRFSAAFSFVTDVALLTLGGTLKRRERLSARLADILSHLYMASAVLKHFVDQGRPAADQPLVDWALADSLHTIETSLLELLRNLPNRWVGRVLRLLVLPLGPRMRAPDDGLCRRVARVLMEPSETRDRLTAGLFIRPDDDDPVGLMDLALDAVLEAEPLEKRLAESTGRRLGPGNIDAALAAAVGSGAIDEAGAAVVRRAAALTLKALSVDSFEPATPRADCRQP